MFKKIFNNVKRFLAPRPKQAEVVKPPEPLRKIQYAKPTFTKRKNPFQIRHGRKEAGCKWWPEIGTGYVLQIRKTHKGAFRYLVAFPFLGAHLDRKTGKWVGLLRGVLWLPESELS